MAGGAMSDPPSRASSKPAVLGLTALLGLLSGIAILALTALVERSDLTVFDRSLRGNGALVVPLVGAPAALATGWSALTLSLPARRRRVAGRARPPAPLAVPLAGLATLLSWPVTLSGLALWQSASTSARILLRME